MTTITNNIIPCATTTGKRTQPDLESSTREPRAEEAGTGKITPWPEDPPKPVTLDDLTERGQKASIVSCRMSTGKIVGKRPRIHARTEGPKKHKSKGLVYHGGRLQLSAAFPTARAMGCWVLVVHQQHHDFMSVNL